MYSITLPVHTKRCQCLIKLKQYTSKKLPRLNPVVKDASIEHVLNHRGGKFIEINIQNKCEKLGINKHDKHCVGRPKCCSSKCC